MAKLKRRNNDNNMEGVVDEYQMIALARIRGLRPLLHHNPKSSDESPKGKKTKVYDPKEEATKGLYCDEKGNPCQPAEALEKAMTKSAVQFKYAGKKTYKDLVASRVWITPVLIPLDNSWVIDERGVKIGSARITRWRPRWDEWELEFQVHSDDREVQPIILRDILQTAGRIGIGDYRPRFGIFRLIHWEVLQES